MLWGLGVGECKGGSSNICETTDGRTCKHIMLGHYLHQNKQMLL